MTANPERENFFDATAQILGHAYILMGKDLSEIMPHYGYSSKTGDMLTGHVAQVALARRGVQLATEKYKGYALHGDESLGEYAASLAGAKAKIDETMLQRYKYRGGSRAQA